MRFSITADRSARHNSIRVGLVSLFLSASRSSRPRPGFHSVFLAAGAVSLSRVRRRVHCSCEKRGEVSASAADDRFTGSRCSGHSSASNSDGRRSRFAGNKVIARVLISARSPILRPIDKRAGAAVIKISQRQNTFRRENGSSAAHVQRRGPN